MGAEEGTKTPDPSDILAALSVSRVGVWTWDVRQNTIRWSPVVTEIAGLPPGTHPETLDEFLSSVHPDDRTQTEAEVAAALEALSDDYSVEYRVIHPDGAVRWIAARGAVVVGDDGAPLRMLGVAVDITDRKAIDEERQMFTELATDYVYRVDVNRPTMAPEIVGGSFERTTGLSPTQVAERGGWPAVIHPDDRERAMTLLGDMLMGRPVVSEYRIIGGQGDVRWLRDTVRPVVDEASGAVTHLMGGVRDITEQHRLREQLIHAQKLDALAQLAAGVAHDFNNLLSIIFMASDELRQDQSHERRLESLEQLDRASASAAELTRGLLSLGRRQATEVETVPVAAFLQSCRPIFERARKNQIQLDVSVPGAELTVLADHGQLQLVLLNLLLNACQASERGDTVSLEVSSLTIAVDDPGHPPEIGAGRWVRLTVTDRGTGMDPDTRARIFEPFFTTKPLGQGTGLGLAISHSTVRQMGGVITADSEPGVGTTLTVYLERGTDAGAEPASPGKPVGAVGGTERVLVVEDEPAVRRAAARSLRDRGYDVVEAPDAESALALEPEVLASFDALLTDVGLPGIDGLELARRLSERFPRMRVLVMSGYLPPDAQKRVARSERLDFLAKPFSPAGLAVRLREALDREDAT